MKNKKLIGLSLTLLGLVLTYVGTYAYYMKVINGTITGRAGAFTFDVLHNNKTFKNIDLYETMENPSLTSKYIIPGDSGKFDLLVDATGSSTGVEYEIDFVGTNIPTNMKFYLDENKTEEIELEYGLIGYIKSTDETKNKLYTIYWEWPYDSGSNNYKDIDFQDKEMTFDVTAIGKQSSGYAMMMNGDITEHPNRTSTAGMWKDEYRKLIKTLTFSNDLSNMPTNCTEENLCWDISDESSAYPVYHYLVQNQTETTKYDAYIVSEQKIYAPKDCFALFDLSNYESNDYVSSLESINFNNNFDTSKVRNMSSMFEQLVNLKSIDVSNFDTSKVVNMLGLFYMCKSLTELDVSNFDTSKVTDMSWMFMDLNKIINLDLSSFDTSNVSNMYSMFTRCYKLKKINVSSFDTSKVTDMQSMFSNCSSLESLDLSNFNTSNVTSMHVMFQNVSSLKSLDLSNFDTSNVTSMKCMFQRAAALETLDLSSFDTSNVTDMEAMFGGTAASGDMHLKEIKISDKFVTDKVTSMLQTFRLCKYLNFTINITGNKVTSYTNMFSGAATEPGAKIVVNYTTETESLVDQMIATKTSNSNVVKGSLIS